jgi:DNA-binding transcriptional LysR family regulator
VLDWDDLRFFLSIARHGSLTAASTELRVAQSTVGRRLASLEAGLGVRLLHRTPDGYVVTLAGESVRAQAERAEAEIIGVLRSVGGHDTRLEGLVSARDVHRNIRGLRPGVLLRRPASPAPRHPRGTFSQRSVAELINA